MGACFLALGSLTPLQAGSSWSFAEELKAKWEERWTQQEDLSVAEAIKSRFCRVAKAISKKTHFGLNSNPKRQSVDGGIDVSARGTWLLPDQVLSFDGVEIPYRWVNASTIEYTAPVLEDQFSRKVKVVLKGPGPITHTGRVHLKGLDDNTGPSITLRNELLNETYLQDERIRLHLQDDISGVDVERIRVRFNGQLVENPDITPAAEGGYDVEFETGELSAKKYNLAVRVHDRANQRSFERFSLRVDHTAPEIIVGRPKEGQSFKKSSHKFWGRIKDDGPVDMDSLVVSLDGRELDNVEIHNKRFHFYAKDLSEGAHLINVEVSDGSGKISYSGRGFNIDQTKPEINITNPSEDGLVFTTTTPVLEAVISDLHPNIEKTRVFINGVEQSYNIDGNTITLQPELALGSHKLDIRARDKAGNRIGVRRSFSIEDQPVIVEGENLSDRFNMVTIATDVNPQNLRVLDANKDGKLDIIYKDINSNTVKVIYQN